MVAVSVVSVRGNDDALNPCANRPNGYFANNPINCGAFWRCENGLTATTNRCPNGLNFNEAAQLCDLPENHPCHDGDTTTPSSPLASSTQGIVVDRPIYVVDDNIDATHPCYNRPNGYFVSNPKNCQAYWFCMAGQAHSGQCPPNYNFNEAAQNCDDPALYPCQSHVDDDSSEEEDAGGEPVNQCPGAGIYAYYKAGSCDEFNFCFAGYHSVRRCADGLQFEQSTSQCNFAEVVRCARDRCPITNDPNNIVTHLSTSRCDE